MARARAQVGWEGTGQLGHGWELALLGSVMVMVMGSGASYMGSAEEQIGSAEGGALSSQAMMRACLDGAVRMWISAELSFPAPELGRFFIRKSRSAITPPGIPPWS